MSATIAPSGPAPTSAPVQRAAAKRAWVSRVLGVHLGEEEQSASSALAGTAAREIEAGMGSLTMAFRKARLGWGTARGEARAAIAGLQAKLREVLADEADFAALDAEIGKFDGIMSGLDDRLETVLDRAMNAEADARETFKREAVGLVGEYTRFIETHPFLRKIDGNEIMPVQVFAKLSAQLGEMARELG